MQMSFAQNSRRRHVAIAAILSAVTLAGAAMAQATMPELQQALQAVERADRADADQYAPELLDSARQALSAAQAASQGGRKERRQAAVLAQRAAADADLARVRSDDAVVQAQLGQHRAEIAELQRRLDGAGGTP